MWRLAKGWADASNEQILFWGIAKRSCNVAVRRILDARGQYSAVCDP